MFSPLWYFTSWINEKLDHIRKKVIKEYLPNKAHLVLTKYFRGYFSSMCKTSTTTTIPACLQNYIGIIMMIILVIVSHPQASKDRSAYAGKMKILLLFRIVTATQNIDYFGRQLKTKWREESGLLKYLNVTVLVKYTKLNSFWERQFENRLV